MLEAARERSVVDAPREPRRSPDVIDEDEVVVAWICEAVYIPRTAAGSLPLVILVWVVLLLSGL